MGREEHQGQVQLVGDMRVGTGVRLEFEGARLLGHGHGGVGSTFKSIDRDYLETRAHRPTQR